MPYRCDDLTQMLEIINTFSVLGRSNIEGIDVIHSRFQLIVTAMKKKSYNLLDHRKRDFYDDFDEFKRSIQDILVSFCCSVIQNLKLKQLGGPCEFTLVMHPFAFSL